MSYDEALPRCGIETLENRREIICINLVKNMIDSIHKLHDGNYTFTITICLVLAIININESFATN